MPTRHLVIFFASIASLTAWGCGDDATCTGSDCPGAAVDDICSDKACGDICKGCGTQPNDPCLAEPEGYCNYEGECIAMSPSPFMDMTAFCEPPADLCAGKSCGDICLGCGADPADTCEAEPWGFCDPSGDCVQMPWEDVDDGFCDGAP